jgi:hypothetical protein
VPGQFFRKFFNCGVSDKGGRHPRGRIKASHMSAERPKRVESRPPRPIALVALAYQLGTMITAQLVGARRADRGLAGFDPRRPRRSGNFGHVRANPREHDERQAKARGLDPRGRSGC